MTRIVTNDYLLDLKLRFKKAGLQVVHDREAGTMTVTDSDRVNCLQAVQTKRRGNWLATFKDSENVKWSKDGSIG